jgi:hypothetical protein
MGKVYYVMIKGRTLESRDLKELLARAVTEKRNMDRKERLRSRSQGLLENPVKVCTGTYSAAMF